MPEMRRIGHRRAMICGGKQTDPFLLGDCQVIMDRAVGVSRGNCVGMGIDCEHGSPGDCFLKTGPLA